MNAGGSTPPWLARILHALIVGTYPRRIRARFGAEMQQLFIDSYAEARKTKITHSMPRFYLKAFFDLGLNSLKSRMESRRRNVSAVENLAASRARDSLRSPSLLDSVNEATRGIRHALRGLRKAPSFSFVVLITLGLGIGASTAIFSVVDGILLSSLPYPEADNLVVLREQSPPPEVRIGWVAEPTFRDWREQTTTFDDIVAWRLNLATLTGGEAPERVQGYVVSAGFFATMGIEMTMGRGFLEEEDHPDANKVVVISNGLWHRRFGSDPNVLGQNLVMDGISHTIVGVAGETHKYPGNAEMWSPIALEFEPTFRGFRYLGLIGRINSGVSLQEAEADLERVAAEIAIQHQDTNAGWGSAIEPLRATIVGRLQPVLIGMLVAVLLLLLIAVGNVTNLFMARLMDRQTEVAIRRALGASRGSLARLFLTEAALLSVFGCALGIGAAVWGTKILEALARGNLPRLDQVGIDGRVLMFAVLLSMAVALVIGLFPTLVSSGARMGGEIRSGNRSSTGHARANRAREIVLTVQVAMAITLMVGASLLVRSLWNLHHVDPGFNPEQVVSFELNFPDSRYDAERLQRVFPELMERVGGIPGVLAAGYVHPMPMVLGSIPSRYAVRSSGDHSDGAIPMAHPRMTTPGFFQAMRIPVLLGRDFEPGDGPNDLPVAVVNQTFATRFLDTENPIGEQITWGNPEDPDAVWFTVVGVVGDVVFRRLTDPTEPEVYTSVLQTPIGFGQIVLRYQGPPEQLRAPMVDVFRSIDPDLAVATPLRAETTIEESLGPAKLNTTLISFFAAVAGILALVGVLGVLTIVVGHRIREIGIRMVLGAQPREILGFVLSRGMRPVLIGVVLGSGASVGLTRFLDSQVYGTSTLDPVAFLIPSSCFLVTSMIACHWPAKRAARLDPALVLRAE